jgi:hypothetical protein
MAIIATAIATVETAAAAMETARAMTTATRVAAAMALRQGHAGGCSRQS